MKNAINILLLSLVVMPYCAQNTGSSLDNQMQENYNKRVIPNAQIGDLIALDEFGNFIIASGGDFEIIKGFTTSTPYVTPNKPLELKGSKVEFIGIASIESGIILVNDYLCPSSKIPGKVKKCTKNDNPYAIAQEDASVDLQKIKVKVIARNL